MVCTRISDKFKRITLIESYDPKFKRITLVRSYDPKFKRMLLGSRNPCGLFE